MQQPQGVQINLADYLKGKSDGTTKVVKLEGKIYYSQRKFHVETGRPEPLLVPMDKAELIKAKEDMEASLTAMTTLIQDIDKATELIK